MIEDIKLIGLSDDVIDKIMSQLDYDTILNLAVNHQKVKDNVEFFKSLKITFIDQLLINKTDIFFKDVNLLKEKFSKYNNDIIVELLNNDYTMIDEIL